MSTSILGEITAATALHLTVAPVAAEPELPSFCRHAAPTRRWTGRIRAGEKAVSPWRSLGSWWGRWSCCSWSLAQCSRSLLADSRAAPWGLRDQRQRFRKTLAEETEHTHRVLVGLCVQDLVLRSRPHQRDRDIVKTREYQEK